MGTVAVIGEQSLVAGYVLCGALVLAAGDPEAVRQAWRSMPGDVDVVILTRAAAAALEGREGRPEVDPAQLWPLRAVMPR
jgi:vacuolar-type H+-ATPase subunit F/Vma7